MPRMRAYGANYRHAAGSRRHDAANRTHHGISPWRRLRLPVGLVAFSLAFGVAGYMLTEGFDLLDAIYTSVITVAAVGYGLPKPLTDAGEVFTVILILIGVASVFYLVAEVTSVLASGILAKTRERRRMERRIEHLREHTIVCAYGRVGRAACEQLIEKGDHLVVVESDPTLADELEAAGIPHRIADPSSEAVLDDLGIRRAKALVCAVDSDAVNVYITLTARALNPDVFIVARASRPESVDRLRRAGADRIVSPYSVSGRHMAELALRPAMLDFFDMVSVAPDLRMEELEITHGSRLANRRVAEACAGYERVLILAVRKPSGELLVPVQGDTMLEQLDRVIVVGPTAALTDLARAAG